MFEKLQLYNVLSISVVRLYQYVPPTQMKKNIIKIIQIHNLFIYLFIYLFICKVNSGT